MVIKLKTTDTRIEYNGTIAPANIIAWTTDNPYSADTIIGVGENGIKFGSIKWSNKPGLACGTVRAWCTAVNHATAGTTQATRDTAGKADNTAGKAGKAGKTGKAGVQFQIAADFKSIVMYIPAAGSEYATYNVKTGMVCVPLSLYNSYSGVVARVAREDFAGYTELVDGAPVEAGFTSTVCGTKFRGADEAEIRASVAIEAVRLCNAGDKAGLDYAAALLGLITIIPVCASRITDYKLALIAAAEAVGASRITEAV